MLLMIALFISLASLQAGTIFQLDELEVALLPAPLTEPAPDIIILQEREITRPNVEIEVDSGTTDNFHVAITGGIVDLHFFTFEDFIIVQNLFPRERKEARRADLFGTTLPESTRFRVRNALSTPVRMVATVPEPSNLILSATSLIALMLAWRCRH
jgi:hypothetical protein